MRNYGTINAAICHESAIAVARRRSCWPRPSRADAASPPPTPRPNIVLIQADDLGYGDLSAYGQAQFQTPALDRLAAEGIRFTQYYAGSTVCAPSRAALMTGLHTGHAWIRGNGEIPLRDEDVTVAMALRDAGYRTAVIGKWGLGRPGHRRASRTRRASTTRSASSIIATRIGSSPITCIATASPVPTDLEQDYVNDLFTREAAAFIEQPDPRPFFLYLNYTVPHAELRVPEDSLAPMRGKFPETPFVNADRRRAADRARRRRRSAIDRSRRRRRRSPR